MEAIAVAVFAILVRFRRRRLRRAATLASALLVGLSLCVPLSAAAQESPPPPEAAQLLSPAELDQLLAPIALYPDQLLADILMAATYPLEVVEAARWVQDPNNAALKGDQLAEALAREDWAPSVKALVPFPDVLRMMDSRLDWMQQLGNAFLAQEDDVMDAVQRLRQAAEAAGTLQSTPQQQVMTEGTTIIIQPAQPDVVYVPYYDPFIVYGVWPYPAYPPVYFPLPSIYVTGVLHPAPIFFGVGVVVVNLLWDWHHWDWRRHHLYIDVRRYNALNVGRPRITRDLWAHDSYHRRGVIYPTRRLQERYRHTRTIGSPETLRKYRGYTGSQLQAPSGTRARPAERQRSPLDVQPRPAAPQRSPLDVPPRPAERQRSPLDVSPRRTERQRIGPSPAERRRSSPQPMPAPVQRQRPSPPPSSLGTPSRRPAAPQAPRARMGTPAPSLSRPSPARTQSPPAFQGIGRGGAVRTESVRGRESRSTQPRLNTAPRPARQSGRQDGRRRDESRRQR